MAAFLLLFLLASPDADHQLASAVSLAREGKMEEAQRTLEAGLNAFPRDGRFAAELAGIAWRQKQNARARTLLHRAVNLDPKNSYATEFLGYVYHSVGNQEAALKYWNRLGKPVLADFRVVPPLRVHPLLAARTPAASAGQTLTLDRFYRTSANLGRLGFLVPPRLALIPGPSDRFHAEMRAAPFASPAAGWVGRVLPAIRGIGWQALHWDQRNIAGEAVNLSLLGRWDPDKRRASVSVSAPWRRNPRTRLSLFADMRAELWNLAPHLTGTGLMREEAGGEFETALGARGSWTSGLSLTRRRWSRADETNPFRNAWSFAWPNRFEVPLWSRPERRVRTAGSLLISPGRVLGSAPSRFLRLQSEAASEWFPQSRGEDLVIQLRTGAGRIFGQVPLDEYFILGMERDNPLWLRGHPGTRGGRKGSAPLGTAYFRTQTELRRTVFRLPLIRVMAGPFWDSGWVGDRRFGSRGYLHDAGAIVTLHAPGGLQWSFVYGRNLRDGGSVFYAAASRAFGLLR